MKKVFGFIFLIVLLLGLTGCKKEKSLEEKLKSAIKLNYEVQSKKTLNANETLYLKFDHSEMDGILSRNVFL